MYLGYFNVSLHSNQKIFQFENLYKSKKIFNPSLECRGAGRGVPVQGNSSSNHSLSAEFCTYLHYVRNLDFFEVPDYAYLRRLFQDLYERSGFPLDGKFDWSGKVVRTSRVVVWLCGHVVMLCGVS